MTDHARLLRALQHALLVTPALPALEILAVASQFVGNLIAVQDHRSVTPDMALEVVTANMELGNASAVSALMQPRSGSEPILR